MKRSLEQKQVQQKQSNQSVINQSTQVADLAMIPTKEVKAILYSLVTEKYARLQVKRTVPVQLLMSLFIHQEIPRSDSGSSKSVYLFSVNLQHLARSLLDQCYKVCFCSSYVFCYCLRP